MRPIGGDRWLPSACLEADSLKLVEFFIAERRQICLYTQRIVGIALDGHGRKPRPLEGHKLVKHARHPVAKRFKRPLFGLRLERLPGGNYTRWKAPPYHGAHFATAENCYTPSCSRYPHRLKERLLNSESR
jgi:hypothetical protein